MSLQLEQLHTKHEQSFKTAVRACENDSPPWDFAFHFDFNEDFSEYASKVESWSRGENLPENFVPDSFYVGIVKGEVVGRVSIRHYLSDWLMRIGGHIGYGVVPKHRKKGYATEMLRQTLPICAKLKIDEALVTCDIDNIGSRKVIENCNGAFEGITDDPELKIQKRRYWISTTLNASFSSSF